MEPLAAAREAARAKVLAKATTRAAERLGISQRELAEILGMSEASVSRMKHAAWSGFTPKQWELAALMVRVFRSADALFGGNEVQVKKWFRADNRHLNGTPHQLVKRVEGLVHVAGYLDAMRGAL